MFPFFWAAIGTHLLENGDIPSILPALKSEGKPSHSKDSKGAADPGDSRPRRRGRRRSRLFELRALERWGDRHTMQSRVEAQSAEVDRLVGELA
jgi:hypothetical protein